jgi:hypothetical protein
VTDRQQQYELAGPWMATDDTRNHVEIARTAKAGVIAMRSTFQPDQVLFITSGQLRSAIEALETKPELRELVHA